MLVATLGVSAALSVAPLFFSFAGGTPSPREQVEDSLGGDRRGLLHLIASEVAGGREWKAFAYLDGAGRPCIGESLGGGGCHPYAGRVKGELGDYHADGASFEDGVVRAEYVVVRGAVPADVTAVVVELDDGAVERVETHALPGSRVRMFALLSEGDSGRTVRDVRAAE